jgi:predicted nucleic acid-binding protein
VNDSGSVVIDANVLVKLFVEETLTQNARVLANGPLLGIAPDFIAVELANVFRKKILRGELTEDEALLAIDQIPSLVRLRPVAPLTSAALAISVTHNRSFYDSLYLALAIREGCTLVSADERLINALKPHYPDTLVWLGDLPTS